jgi:hypothetical protein
MSFGTGSWGLDYWGTDPTLYMQSAVATTTHSVTVTLSQPVRARSAISAGDALNPRTWTVTRVDTSQVFTVVGVLQVTTRRFLLFLRTPLSSYNRTHRVRATDLVSTAGILIAAPYEVDFRGVLPTTEVNERTGPFDLLTTDVVGGGLQTTEGGAYARIYGDDVIRKMIYRRLSTMPGSFFHLNPDEFGVGLKVKEVLRASSLPALKVKIEQELLREPGVLGVSTQLSLANGILVIKANVRTANGNTETIIEAR